MYRVHTLPTSLENLPAQEDGEEKPLRSIEDRLFANPQARQTWLTSAFSKFSTKSRGSKTTEIWQPPHTLRFRGKCDIEIGPHVFYATSVYEVTYHPYSVPAIPSATSDGVSQSHTNSSNNNYVAVTNELISQVNVAAQTNHTLANLIAVAASGSATAGQLQSLGVTLQSLAESGKTTNAAPPANASSETSAATLKNNTDGSFSTGNVLSLRPPQISRPSTESIPYQTSSVVHIPAKEPDVLVEFYENASDRWILPKESVVYEKLTRWDGVNSFADILFSTVFPFQYATAQRTSSDTSKMDSSQDGVDVIHPITLRFFNVPISIWNLFASCAADEERTKRVRTAIDAKAATRVYLQHQIPDGPLLSQLQASASDRYPMKGIKTSGLTSGQAKRRASAIAAKDGTASAPKKKKPAPAKKAESRTGTCIICKRASIVLAPDSAFCPPCKKKVLAGEVVPPPAGPILPALSTEQTGGSEGKSSENITMTGSSDPLTSASLSYTAHNGSQFQNYCMWQSPYAQYQAASGNPTVESTAQHEPNASGTTKQ